MTEQQATDLLAAVAALQGTFDNVFFLAHVIAFGVCMANGLLLWRVVFHAVSCRRIL